MHRSRRFYLCLCFSACTLWGLNHLGGDCKVHQQFWLALISNPLFLSSRQKSLILTMNTFYLSIEKRILLLPQIQSFQKTPLKCAPPQFPANDWAAPPSTQILKSPKMWKSSSLLPPFTALKPNEPVPLLPLLAISFLVVWFFHYLTDQL